MNPESVTVRSFDATAIEAKRFGHPGDPAILIANGIGAGMGMWRLVLPRLVDAGTSVVMWDYRGLGDSGAPASDRIDPGAHAEDGLAVARHFGLARFSLVAWSTGGRIAIEMATRDPNRIESLALVCAGAGHSMRRFVRFLELSPILPTAAGVAKHFSGPIEGAWRRVVSRPEFAGLVRQSGMIGPTGDIAALVEHSRDLARCDARSLLATFEAVVGDSGESLLRSLEPPVFLIGGARDRWTPARMLEDHARKIPRARLEIYEGATHFLPIEYPEKLAEDLVGATTPPRAGGGGEPATPSGG